MDLQSRAPNFSAVYFYGVLWQIICIKVCTNISKTRSLVLSIVLSRFLRVRCFSSTWHDFTCNLLYVHSSLHVFSLLIFVFHLSHQATHHFDGNRNLKTPVMTRTLHPTMVRSTVAKAKMTKKSSVERHRSTRAPAGLPKNPVVNSNKAQFAVI
jgi:hypothetical protein